MLRDNLAGLIEPMIDCAGVHALGGHPKSGLTGGCSRSTRLAIVALKRSLRHMFRWKTRRQVERATSPGFELTTVAHGLCAVGTTQTTNHRTIDPQCLENPRPAGAESTLTDNAASPFHAEPRHPRYNIAPTQQIPVICQHPKEPIRLLSLMRWGLIPSWAKKSSAAASMINARSETAATKPAFRDPLANRRCLIPADGFYEWSRHEAACVIVRRAPLDRTCHPIGSTLRGMAIR
jgi:hypothetical protein